MLCRFLCAISFLSYVHCADMSLTKINVGTEMASIENGEKLNISATTIEDDTGLVETVSDKARKLRRVLNKIATLFMNAKDIPKVINILGKVLDEIANVGDTAVAKVQTFRSGVDQIQERVVCRVCFLHFCIFNTIFACSAC